MYEYEILQELRVHNETATTPHRMYPVEFKHNDTHWTCYYGDIYGHGSTPCEACTDFDRMFYNGKKDDEPLKTNTQLCDLAPIFDFNDKKSLSRLRRQYGR